MKKILVLLAAMSLGGAFTAVPRAAAAQTAQTQVVGGALLDFEGAISWASVSPVWRTARPAWVAAVRAATTPQELAAQTFALEVAMGWGAVNDSWRQERPAWVAQLRAAQTESDVARALLRLEAVTKWEAVTPAWRSRRTTWVASLALVTGG
jgi:hypothetical protein